MIYWVSPKIKGYDGWKRNPSHYLDIISWIISFKSLGLNLVCLAEQKCYRGWSGRGFNNEKEYLWYLEFGNLDGFSVL